MQPVGSTEYHAPIFNVVTKETPLSSILCGRRACMYDVYLLYLQILKYAALNIINYYHFHLFVRV